MRATSFISWAKFFSVSRPSEITSNPSSCRIQHPVMWWSQAKLTEKKELKNKSLKVTSLFHFPHLILWSKTSALFSLLVETFAKLSLWCAFLTSWAIQKLNYNESKKELIIHYLSQILYFCWMMKSRDLLLLWLHLYSLQVLPEFSLIA